MICPICKSQTDKIKTTVKTRNVYGCFNCDVEFIYPQLSDTELGELYLESYYKSWGMGGRDREKIVKKMKKTTFEMLIKIIKKYKSKGRMLDVGCATGFFLEVAQEEGFIPYGVEISSYSSNLSQAQFGKQNVFKGILEDCEFADNFFDIITMSDLLEHVREPNKTLQKAKQLLKDDGIMLIVTPDSKSLSHKIMGSKWTHYKLEHFYYFNQDSLKYLAEENGLSLDYFAQTKKAINFEYLYAQFQVYPYWLIAPILNAADKILPKKLKTNNFRITMGEITAILKKKQI